jgi:hypothetical protein
VRCGRGAGTPGGEPGPRGSTRQARYLRAPRAAGRYPTRTPRYRHGEPGSVHHEVTPSSLAPPATAHAARSGPLSALARCSPLGDKAAWHRDHIHGVDGAPHDAGEVLPRGGIHHAWHRESPRLARRIALNIKSEGHLRARWARAHPAEPRVGDGGAVSVVGEPQDLPLASAGRRALRAPRRQPPEQPVLGEGLELLCGAWRQRPSCRRRCAFTATRWPP